MSNIHGFHNLSAPQPAQQGQRAGGATSGGGSRWGTQSTSQLPLPGGMDDEGTGISMLAPKPRPDGMQPELSERIFPGITWWSVTTFISIVDVILFIIELIVGGAKYDGAFVKGNDMGGPSAVTLCNMGGKWYPSIRAGNVWRLFTAILLHAGILHIAGNLFFQLRFGYITEQRWGHIRWAVIYVLTGLMASLWSTVLGPKNVSVGASGALFGIIGADITYIIYNWRTIPHNKQEACLIMIVVVVNFLLGMSGNIDNYAHLGGLISGLFLGVAIPPHLVVRQPIVFIRGLAAFIYAAMFLMFVLLTFVGDPWSDAPVMSQCS